MDTSGSASGTVSDNTLTSNKAAGGTGGVGATANSAAPFHPGGPAGDGGRARGGGIYSQGGDHSLLNLSFINNTANEVYFADGTPTFQANTLSVSQARGGNGALQLAYASCS